MSLYLIATATFKVAENSTLAELLASRAASMTEITDHVEFVSHHISLANGASASAVNLGPLTTCKALYIHSTRKITANIDGSEAVPVGHTDAEEAWLVLPATSFTSLTLDNSSGSAAEVYVAMAGA